MINEYSLDESKGKKYKPVRGVAKKRFVSLAQANQRKANEVRKQEVSWRKEAERRRLGEKEEGCPIHSLEKTIEKMCLFTIWLSF